MGTKSNEWKSSTALPGACRRMALQVLLRTAIMPLLSLLLTLEVSAQCAVDDFNPNANSRVYTIVVQPDGKVLVGGDFTAFSPNGGAAVTRNKIARFNPEGTLDASFNPNANGRVNVIALQADGRILAGGTFTTIGGRARNKIARLNATSGLADAFDPNADGDVYALAVQADGKIIAGGLFETIGGEPRNHLARLEATSGLADAFDPSVDFKVLALAVQADGRIIAGGEFNLIGGQLRPYLARLDPMTGAVDLSFAQADGAVRALTAQADGKILAGGGFGRIGGQVRRHLARIDPVTGMADSLPTGADSWVTSVAVQPDSNILVAGSFRTIGGQTREGLARLNGTTGAADSFNAHVIAGFVDAVAVSPDGKVLAGGSFDTISRRQRNRIAKLDPACTQGILGNISTRVRVLSGDNALIGGMIAKGHVAKPVILRALGPVLGDFGVAGALVDPTLEIYRENTLVAMNDNWRDDVNHALIEASGLAPTKDGESAIYLSLSQGENYTAVVRGKNGASGVGVVEVYDMGVSASSYLANISTRGFVDVDDNVMIAGLIVSPSHGSTTKVLVRALGPTLGNLGVAGFLANPTLELVNSSGTVIRSNDNWRTDQQSEIEAANLAPSHDEEAALVHTVSPDAYTAVVRGNNRGTGVGLVEVYNIP